MVQPTLFFFTVTLCVAPLLWDFVLSVAVEQTLPLKRDHRISFNVFFTSQAKECASTLSILQAHENQEPWLQLFSDNVTFASYLVEAMNHEAHLRSHSSFDSQEINLSSKRTPRLDNSFSNLHVPFQTLDRETRRDITIGYLSLLSQKLYGKPKMTLEGVRANYTSVSRKFLPTLHIDIIEMTSSRDYYLFRMAQSFPCLSFTPEMNQRRYLASAATRGLRTKTTTRKPFPVVIPDDPDMFPKDGIADGQWYLEGPHTGQHREEYGANVLPAWTITRGENGPTIAVLDTGCSAHPDLQENLCESGDCKGYDVSRGTENFHAEALNRIHGTATAGIIAATANNEYQTSGICWGCPIMCLKVYDRDDGISMTNVIQAYEYAVTKSVRILYQSYYGFTSSAVEKYAISLLLQLDTLIVTPAGNINCNLDQTTQTNDACYSTDGTAVGIYPPSYKYANVLVVGSVNRQGQKAKYSTYGAKNVHVFAPGDSLLFPYNTVYTPLGIGSGTSYSAAIVTGIVGLLLSRDNISLSDLMDLLESTTKKVPELEGYCRWGGVIDAYAAVKKMGGLVDPPIPRKYPYPGPDRTSEYYITTSGLDSRFSFLSYGLLLPLLLSTGASFILNTHLF